MGKRLILGVLVFILLSQQCMGISFAAEPQTIPEMESQTESEIETELKTEPGSEKESELETEVGIELPSEAKSEKETELESEKESELESKTKIEKESELEPETKPEKETELQSETEMPQVQNDEDETEAVEEGDPAYLFQAGGFKVLNEENGFENEISLFSTGNMDVLADEIYKALKKRARSIDIKKYAFYYTSEDREQLLTLFYAVVNDHPDLYYVRTAYGISYGTTTKLISKITPQYFPNVDDEAFQKGVQEAKSVVTEGMDDLQTAIAIHEYIVLNCEYDKERLTDGTIPKESYSAYGVLANHIAVCQGYALAYKYLMNEYGIECYIVTSDKMNHAWNIVQIDGELYQVDATWDDPTWDKYGLVSHSYLLQSDKEFQTSSSGHSTHHDWYVTKGSGIVDIKAEGTAYDDAFWRNVKSPLVYDGSETKKYYYVSEEKELQSRVYGTDWSNASPDTLKTIDTPYSGLALDGTKLYYNTNKNISYIDISIDISESAEEGADKYQEQVRYSLDSGDTDNIYGFTRIDNFLRYVKRTSFSLSGKSVIYTLDDSKENVSEAEGKTFTVTFQDDYGTIFDTQTVSEGGYAVPPDKKAVFPTGYQLSYWKGNYSNVRKDETVLAVYTKISYKISYVLNGGKNNSKNATKYDIETDTISLEAPTREHYDFAGWYSDSGYETPVSTIPKGSTGNLTLYAKWTPQQYHITYELDNGINSSENPAEYNIETEDIILNEPTRAHYNFVGWYEDVAYQTKVTAIQNGSTGERTLYAKWVPITYHITYELNGGINDTTNPVEYDIETDTVFLAVPTHENERYRFEGWYAEEEFTHELTAIEQGSTGDIRLYAKWGRYYRVRFYDASDKLVSEIEVKEGAAASAPEVFDISEGYELQGWDKDYADVRGDLDIKAIYRPRQYTITYVLHDGVNSVANPAAYTIETDTFQIAAPTHPKKELTFAGWYYDETYQKAATFVNQGSVGDITLYARWTGIWMEAGELSENSDVSYTGNAVTFDSITVYNGYDALRQGIDYTIKYVNNVNAADMTADKAPAVVITGKGNFQGKYTKTFTIKPVDIKDISVPEMAAVYKKGKVQKPVPTVIWNGKKLANNKDFTVSYEKPPIDVGPYEAVITGKGNFTGTVTTKLTITDNADKVAMSSVKISKKIPAQEYSANGVTLQESMITLKYGKTELVAGKDYEFVEDTYKGAGTHYVTIRGTGEKYIGEITTTFTVKGTIASQFKTDSVLYTGDTVKPVIKDKSGKLLAEGEDYVINSLTDAESAGTAKVKVTGINAYYGTTTKSFKVKARSVNDSGVTAVFVKNGSTQPYEKNGAKPKVMLTYNGRTLTEGTDYTLSYKNNKTVGQKATVVITGKKNFNAKRTLSFTVGTGSLQNTSVTVADKVVSSKVGKYVSAPILKDSNGNKLAAGKDYDRNVIYRCDGIELNKKADRLSAGAVVTVEIRGKGNYAGTSTTAQYRILDTGKDISKAKVTVFGKFYYNGSSVTLSPDDLTVKIGKVTLSADDYEILPETYADNNKKGTAKVTIRGTGAYGGTKTICFKIYPQKMEK